MNTGILNGWGGSAGGRIRRQSQAEPELETGQHVTDLRFLLKSLVWIITDRQTEKRWQTVWGRIIGGFWWILGK